MTVVKGKRKESSVEFDNAYYTLFNDAIRILSNNFGANKDVLNEYKLYVSVTSKEILETIHAIGRNIRIANSIYPTKPLEYEQRRVSQGIAIGLCYDLLTKYELTMQLLKIKDNKYVNEIKNIRHEINCIKKWRISDKKRFADVIG